MPSTGSWAVVEALSRNAAATGGVVRVAIHGDEGELFSHNGDRRFRAASTIKLPIVIEAYREIEAGTLNPDGAFRLRDENRVLDRTGFPAVNATMQALAVTGIVPFEPS